MIDIKENLIIENLIREKYIPQTGIFQITESQLAKYVAEYGDNFGKRDNKLKSSNYRYARRLAGKTLIKLNKARGAKFTDIKAGMVYIIENPVFPDHYKIGMTLDVHDRLATYQTYDPLRRYSLLKYEFVLDKKLTESRILSHPEAYKEAGEWIRRDKAFELFESICAFGAASEKFRDKRLEILNT